MSIGDLKANHFVISEILNIIYYVINIQVIFQINKSSRAFNPIATF